MSDLVFFAQDNDGFLRRWTPPKTMLPIKPASAMGVRELGRAAGLSPTTVMRIKRGEYGTSLRNLRKALPFLDVCPCCGKETCE